MITHLSDAGDRYMENLKEIIKKVFLGIDEMGPQKVIILNIEPAARMPRHVFNKLEISFEYYGQDLHCRVKGVRSGIPIQLELEPLSADMAADFLDEDRGVCLVEEVTFHHQGQEILRIRNERYNPSCLD